MGPMGPMPMGPGPDLDVGGGGGMMPGMDPSMMMDGDGQDYG